MVDDRDKLRAGRSPDYPRARSAALAVPVEVDDEGSIPVFIPPGVRAPTPPPKSRVRYYQTPIDFAEADQRRLERVLNGAIHGALKPLSDKIDANHLAAVNARAEQTERIVAIEVAMRHVQAGPDAKMDAVREKLNALVDDRTWLRRLVAGGTILALIGAIVKWVTS